MQHQVRVVDHELLYRWWWGTGDHVEFSRQFLAEGVQWEVVDVKSERILEFVANGRYTEDNVCGDHGARNGHPAERIEELEG